MAWGHGVLLHLFASFGCGAKGSKDCLKPGLREVDAGKDGIDVDCLGGFVKVATRAAIPSPMGGRLGWQRLLGLLLLV